MCNKGINVIYIYLQFNFLNTDMASKNLDLSRWSESTYNSHSPHVDVNPAPKNPLMNNLESSDILKKYKLVPYNMINSISPGMNIRYVVKGKDSLFSRFKRGGIIKNIGTDSNSGKSFLYVTTINSNKYGTGSGWKVILDNVEKIWVLRGDFDKLHVKNLERVAFEEARDLSSYNILDREQKDPVATAPNDTIQLSDKVDNMKYMHENFMKTLNVGIQKNSNDIVLIAKSINGVKQEIRKIEEVLRKIIIILQQNRLDMNSSSSAT